MTTSRREGTKLFSPTRDPSSTLHSASVRYLSSSPSLFPFCAVSIRRPVQPPAATRPARPYVLLRGQVFEYARTNSRGLRRIVRRPGRLPADRENPVASGLQWEAASTGRVLQLASCRHLSNVREGSARHGAGSPRTCLAVASSTRQLATQVRRAYDQHGEVFTLQA